MEAKESGKLAFLPQTKFSKKKTIKQVFSLRNAVNTIF